MKKLLFAELAILCLAAAFLVAGAPSDFLVANDLTVGGIIRGDTLRAGMYMNGNSTATTINTVNVWEEVDNFSQGGVNGWAFSAGDLTASANSTGSYLAAATTSAESAGNNKTYEFSLSVNNNIQSNCLSSRLYSTIDRGNATFVCIIAIADSDVVKLEVRNTTDDTNITIVDANVVLHQI